MTTPKLITIIMAGYFVMALIGFMIASIIYTYGVNPEDILNVVR